MPHREPDAHDAPTPDADTPAGGYDPRAHYCPADRVRDPRENCPWKCETGAPFCLCVTEAPNV